MAPLIDVLPPSDPDESRSHLKEAGDTAWIRTRPSVGSVIRESILRRVVLPAPLRPMTRAPHRASPRTRRPSTPRILRPSLHRRSGVHAPCRWPATEIPRMSPTASRKDSLCAISCPTEILLPHVFELNHCVAFGCGPEGSRGYLGVNIAVECSGELNRVGEGPLDFRNCRIPGGETGSNSIPSPNPSR